MASEHENNLLKTCYFQTTVESVTSDAEVDDGALVSILGPRNHDLYSGVKDLNARNCTAYSSTAPIYGIVDYVGVSNANVMGVNYRIGDSATCF